MSAAQQSDPGQSPALSVVVATRDRPEMVREALTSIREQELPGDGVIEVVVVFDQSDPDHDLADDDARRPVRVVTNTRAAGLAGARNSGIEAARGELVAFCDDDDYWLPGKLAAQVAALEAAPRAALSTCGIRVDYEGESHDRVLEQDLVHVEDLLRDRHTELHPSTFLFRRRVLVDEVGLVEEAVPGGFGEDYDLLLRAAEQAPIANVRRPLVVIRWGGQSYFFRRWETMAAGLGWLLEHHDFDRVPRGAARVLGQIAFANAAQGHRREALSWAGRAARRDPREPRLYLALAVAAGALRPQTVMEALHKRGRGI